MNEMEKRATARTAESVPTEHCYYSVAWTYEKLFLSNNYESGPVNRKKNTVI
jgi:hypothetical protein